MSARQALLERVNHLDEETARQVLEWLDGHGGTIHSGPVQRAGSAAEMMGFARRYRAEQRRTDDWMAELREGERD